MRFINRKAELEELEHLLSLSKKKLFVIALYGLRRVGKTRLILEFLKNKKGLYFFVNKEKTSSDLLREYEGILKESGALGELEHLDSWDKFIEVLIKRNPSIAVFDEFQNFHFIEPAVFGMMQKNVDLNEGTPGMIILSGSLIGLMKKTFQSNKEPLYGRVKKGSRALPLSLGSCISIGQELGLEKEELIKLFCVFCGFPKYYVSIEDYGLQGKKCEEILDALFFGDNPPLGDEAKAILSQEFGRRSGLYYSILEAIAAGNNTISGMAAHLNKPAPSITRQVNELKDKFELIGYEMPYAGKRGIYRIQHPLLRFWFSQIYRDFSDYKSRNPGFLARFRKGLNSYLGRAFEDAAREFLTSKLHLAKAARQWGRIPGAPKGQNTYEIDMIGESAGAIFAFEFKLSDLTEKETASLLKGLEEKVRHVPGLPPTIRLGVVGKKIAGKSRFSKKGYAVFDVEDF